MRVSAIRRNALFAIDELTFELTRAQPPDAAAMLLHELAQKYHIAALSTLLTEADTQTFRRLLGLGGEARVNLLKHLRQHAPDNHWLRCASLLDPYFGCVVAQRLDVAREIASLSPAQWLDGEEYEDDFWYARLMHTIVCLGPSDPTLARIVAEMERCLEGEQSGRLLVSQGLLKRDPSLFEAGLTQLIDERATYFEKKRGTIIKDIDRYETERHLFLEGAALLNIANWSGLATTREKLFIPALMRH